MTERFTISSQIEDRTRQFLKEVIPDTNLPEGVSIVHPSQVEETTQPFIVVTHTPSTGEALKSFRAGASRYVKMTFDPKVLRERLEG